MLNYLGLSFATVLDTSLVETGSLTMATPSIGLALVDNAVWAFFAVSVDLTLPVVTPQAFAVTTKGASLLSAQACSTATLGLVKAPVFTSFIVSAQTGVLALSVTKAIEPWALLLEAMDPFLLVAELACLGFVVFALGHLAKACIPASVGYTDLITACQTRGISVAETFCCITFFLGFLVFDIFVTLAEDDILEGVSYVFVSIIALAGLLLVAAVDVQYYYMISSISGGELTLRVLYADLVANALCLLRVFFCWVRYLFYDLQGELVDLTFFYTELPEEGLLALNLETHVGPGFSWSLLALVTAAIVTTFFDGVALLLQLFVSLFKLALALFLFWLILDLFLLRTFARVESRWSLLRGKRKV